MTAIVPEHRTALGPHLRDLQVILASAPARAAAVVACTVPAATSGPPLHIHAACDEIFFIVFGKLLVHADGHVATIGEGGLVHVSCGMPHTFATTPGTPASFLVLSTTRPDRMTAAPASNFVDDSPGISAGIIACRATASWTICSEPPVPTVAKSGVRRACPGQP